MDRYDELYQQRMRVFGGSSPVRFTQPGQMVGYIDPDGTRWSHRSQVPPEMNVHRRRYRVDGREGVFYAGSSTLPDGELFWGPIEDDPDWVKEARAERAAKQEAQAASKRVRLRLWQWTPVVVFAMILIAGLVQLLT